MYNIKVKCCTLFKSYNFKVKFNMKIESELLKTRTNYLERSDILSKILWGEGAPGGSKGKIRLG